MKKYKCLKKNHFEYGSYAIVPIRAEDIYRIREWRNRQIDILRQKVFLSREDQNRYYQNIILPSFGERQPKQILFSLLYCGKLIGYGGLVHVNWQDKRGEISFLVNTNRINNLNVYRNDFFSFLSLIQEVGFCELNFNRLQTEVYDIRPYHVKIIEEAGFVFEGKMRKHVAINGKWCDSLIHAKLRNEYLKSPYRIKVKNKINVLVTSSSLKVPLITEVEKAAKKIDPGSRIICGDANPFCLTRFLAESFWKMPQVERMNNRLMLRILKKKKITHVIPTRDGELMFWSKISEKLRNHGIHVLISNPSTVKKCLDKLSFYQYCMDKRIPAIMTSENIHNIKSDFFVVKDRFGAGSRKIGIRLRRNEAIIHSKKIKNPIFQPFIEGDEYSVDAYVTANKTIKGLISRRRDVVINGESQITTMVNNIKLEKEMVNSIKKMNFYGHIILQVIIDSRKRINIIECNPRFGGASTLSIAGGLDSFFWFFLESLNVSLKNYPFLKSPVPLRLIRYPQDIISEHDSNI